MDEKVSPRYERFDSTDKCYEGSTERNPTEIWVN